jgi:hypothetical protein
MRISHFFEKKWNTLAKNLPMLYNKIKSYGGKVDKNGKRSAD